MAQSRTNGKPIVKPSLFRKFIEKQIALSNRCDAALWPKEQNVDGYQDFKRNLVPSQIKENMHIVDIGGGKRPFLSPTKKSELKATVTGIDIDGDELSQAPKNSYDQTFASDIAEFNAALNADLIICMAAMEHIENKAGALKAMAKILKPGGKALIFLPSRNAWFAILNRMLPEKLKQKLLYYIFPDSESSQGFKAFYQNCTPKNIERLAKEAGLNISEERNYYYSWYFEFFFPFHLLWRLWMQVFMRTNRREASETFALVLEKKD